LPIGSVDDLVEIGERFLIMASDFAEPPVPPEPVEVEKENESLDTPDIFT